MTFKERPAQSAVICSWCRRPDQLFFPQGMHRPKGVCRDCYYAREEARRIERVYGITSEEYQELMEGGCEVCGSLEKLCMDHCHEKDLIRGVLCHQCNTAIGMMKDSPSLLRKAAAYLTGHRLPDA